MHTAALMTSTSPLPAGSTLLGYIDHHPADKQSLVGYAVLRMRTGAEVAWNGQSIRSLPCDWRDRCELTPAE